MPADMKRRWRLLLLLLLTVTGMVDLGGAKGTGGVFVLPLPDRFNVDLMRQVEALGTASFAENGVGPPLEGLPGFHHTYDYALEVMLHQRLLQSPLRTHVREDAALVWVPFYAGLSLVLHGQNATHIHALEQDLLQYLAAAEPRVFSDPRRYVFVLSKVANEFAQVPSEGASLPPWGSTLLLRHFGASTFLSIEKHPGMHTKCLVYKDAPENAHCQNTSHGNFGRVDATLTRARLLGIPYPTLYHRGANYTHTPPWVQDEAELPSPYKHALVCKLSREYETSRLVMPLRLDLAKLCIAHPMCRFTEGLSPEMIIILYGEATFCLQPAGDTSTRKGIFDALLVGCIPVVFHADQLQGQYEVHLPNPWAVAVLVPLERHHDALAYLDSLPVSSVLELRANIAKMAPSLHYNLGDMDGENENDALDVVLSGLLEDPLWQAEEHQSLGGAPHDELR